MADHTFEVTDVFRVAARGTILVGRLSGGAIRPGDRLVSTERPDVAIEIVGVELHDRDDLEAVLVRPDIPDRVQSGAVFNVRSRDIPRH